MRSFLCIAHGACPERTVPLNGDKPMGDTLSLGIRKGLRGWTHIEPGMSINSTSRKGQVQVAALLLAIFMVGMALRLYGLTADGLWLDEITTHYRAMLDIRSLMAHMTSAAAALDQGPLMYLVTHSLLASFGDSDFVLRLQAMLFGSLSIMLIFKVGQMLWGAEAGLIASLLLAVNPYHIQYSQVARHYGLMVFLALLSLIFLLHALRKNQMRTWLAFVLCSSLSLYNHYFAFLFLPAVLVFTTWVVAENWLSYWTEQGHTPRQYPSGILRGPAQQAAMFAASLCLLGVSYLPWLPMLQSLISREGGSQGVGLSRDSLQSSLSFLRAVLSDFSGAEGIPLVLWVVLFLLGLATCSWKRRALIILWTGVPFAFLAIATTEHGAASRYVLFILPMFLLMIAHGAARLGQFPRRRLTRAFRAREWLPRAICVVTVTTLVGLNLARLPHYYDRPKRDWRNTAEYLAVQSGPGDVVLYPGHGTYNVVGDTLQIYLRRRGVEGLPALQIRRGLGEVLAGSLGDSPGQVAAIVYPEDTLAVDQPRGEITMVDFEGVSIVRLNEPSGEVFQDAVSMLEVLVDLLGVPETRFDAHLALADIYVRMGSIEKAELELEMASQTSPGTPRASRHLARTRAEFDQLAGSLDEDIRHPLWRSLGLQVALLAYDLGPTSLRPGGTLEVTLWWQALTEMDNDYTAFIHLLGPDNRVWAQQDVLLVDGGRVTSAWEIGQVVTNECGLDVSTDAMPGEHVLVIGVYNWETGQRLPVWDQEGHRVQDDAIVLGTIDVTAQ